MNLELYAYFATMAYSAYLCFERHGEHYSKYSLPVFLLWFGTLSYIVRISGLDQDMATYATNLTVTSFDTYYIKEPFIWLGTRFVFIWTMNPELTFWIFDIFAGFVTFLAFRAFGVRKYALYSFICFFPFILGQQNVLRQWHAAILILAALAAIRLSKKLYLLPMILAAATHNVAVLFWPIIYAFGFKIRHKIFLWIGLGLVPVALLLGEEFKSSADTGANLVALYLAMLMLFIVFYIASCRFVLKGIEKKIATVMSGCLAVTAISSGLLSSAGSERIGMFSLLILYPFLAIQIEKISAYKSVTRFIFANAGFWPIFLGGTSKFLYSPTY